MKISGLGTTPSWVCKKYSQCHQLNGYYKRWGNEFNHVGKSYNGAFFKNYYSIAEYIKR